MMESKNSKGLRWCKHPQSWGNCTIPQANEIRDNDGDKYCTTKWSATCAWGLMREAGFGLLNFSNNESFCKRPCKYVELSIKHNTFPMPEEPASSNVSWLYLNVPYSYVRVRKEILLLDANAIVGTVGGSMGLFIGFSFLQCYTFLIDSCVNLVSRLKLKVAN